MLIFINFNLLIYWFINKSKTKRLNVDETSKELKKGVNERK